MADSDFTIEGWDEFVEAFAKLVDKWEEKKIILLKRIGTIMEAEIKPLIPVDTSRLADSFSIQVGGSDEVSYATNVHYAIYVDEGHIQHRRFLPIKYLSVGGRSKYVKSSNAKGIMLKEKYVPGVHFVDRGMQNATPRIERLIESFMEQIVREVEGGKL